MPTFLLMRAVVGGSGCSSKTEGDSIGCVMSLMAVPRLPHRSTRAGLAVFGPVPSRRSLPPCESNPLSFDVFPTPAATRLGQRDDPQCTCCLSRDSSPSPNRSAPSPPARAVRGESSRWASGYRSSHVHHDVQGPRRCVPALYFIIPVHVFERRI